LPRRDDVEAQWRLGTVAAELDLAGGQVRLADGESVGFDRLLIATGVRARPWPNPAEAALEGVVVLRTRDDAQLSAGGPPGRVGCWPSGPGSPARGGVVAASSGWR
jgi:NADPH-dependent 2,4-dienoyl-CoA reductase/sulfur reductase-like enzyme